MIVLILAYLVMTLLSLTALPVFSDEAIYIRWSQVAMRVPEKYAFLPMLDGKPPLHAWLLMPFLRIFQNPLFAGRMLSVVTGLVTVLLLPRIVRLLGGGRREELLSMIFGTVLPFFYFHNRMALAESLMGCLFALCIYAALELYQTNKLRYLAVFAVAFGAALWTKTTALFFVPVFAVFPLLTVAMHNTKWSIKEMRKLYSSRATKLLVLGGMVGGLLFGLLAFSPLFPSLFHRSVDYTFSIQQLLSGEWKYVLFTSIPNILFWLVWYMSPFVIFLVCFGGTKNRVLGLMCLAYFLPLALVGRVISARYFFPLAILLVPMAVLGFQALGKKHALQAKLVVAGALFYSAVFMLLAIYNPSGIPFTSQDRRQYLTDWSSGHGIAESAQYLSQEADKHDHITVATEGYFGTLPDGLLIYFDNSTVNSKIDIHGIGEPIMAFPPELKALAATEDVYVVVNENRFFVHDSGEYEVIKKYARPFNAPPLLLLKLKPQNVGANK